MSSPPGMPVLTHALGWRPRRRWSTYGASFTTSQLKELLGADCQISFFKTRPACCPSPISTGWWVKLPHTGPPKRLTINPPKSPQAAAPLPHTPQRPQPLKPFPGLGPVAVSSRRGVRLSFQGPDRGQWQAHHPIGRCLELAAAFVPPRGTGTQQPQRALGTMCCLRLRRLRRCRPRAAQEKMTGLSATKFGV